MFEFLSTFTLSLALITTWSALHDALFSQENFSKAHPDGTCLPPVYSIPSCCCQHGQEDSLDIHIWIFTIPTSSVTLLKITFNITKWSIMDHCSYVSYAYPHSKSYRRRNLLSPGWNASSMVFYHLHQHVHGTWQKGECILIEMLPLVRNCHSLNKLKSACTT